MGRKWDIHLIPGSHFDYGWAASPGECFAYLTEIIRTAIDDITGDYPDYKFTIEYALFLQHFLEVYPEHLPTVRSLLKEGRLEVCPTMSGFIEQWLDGEMIIHQLVRAKRWIRETLDYDAVTAQHSDLPGHVLQIAQFLNGAEIRHLAYSRYRPPSPLHRWRSPDGSEVLACCHFHEPYNVPWDWSGYGWGYTLFVENKDIGVIEKELSAALVRREKIWPKDAPLLMGCQSDLQPPEPEMLDRIRQWNERQPDCPIRISTTTEFFRRVDATKIPVYQGEAPYGFFALASVYVPCAQAMRRGENALAAAEKWSAFAQWSGMGRAPKARIDRARDTLFLPHDHNTAGRRGEVNDAQRENDAQRACLEGEAVFQEKAMAFTVNIRYRGLKAGVFPVVVFNNLSWDRSDVVETYIEVRMTDIRSLRVVNSKGVRMPAQMLSVDERDGHARVYFLFVAEHVPAHGYETFHVEPSHAPTSYSTSLVVTPTRLRNRYFDIRIRGARPASIRWNDLELLGKGPRRFNEIYALEDRFSNVECGPWDIEQNYTGRTWDSRMTKVEIIEKGPVRATVRFHGRILGSRFRQDVTLYDALERIDLRQTLEYRMKMHSMTRVAYPLNVPGAEATYESPYGAVRLETDEMPNTFRGHGERWVQKWIDLSNADFGVTLATRQVSHVVTPDCIEPILVRTALDCGTSFHYYDQNKTYTFDHALYPHRRNWKAAAAHRAGWEFNNPLYACNWTPCYPIKPLRRSRGLPERDSFLDVNRRNVVVTAIAPSADDPHAFIIRLVEFHGKRGPVTLTSKFPILEAVDVNFLERQLGEIAVTRNRVRIDVKAYGIHSIKLKLNMRAASAGC